VPPVLFLQLKMQGSLLGQAERKESPSTLIPDVDNAAVGTLLLCDRRIPQRVFSCFFISFGKGGSKIHLRGGLRGSALSLVEQRWEAVFRRERMPASIDRNHTKEK